MAIENVKWGKDRKEDFRAWMHFEMAQTEGDRQPLLLKWQNDIVQWRARVVGDGVADVPFVGASDLELPLTAMHVDPIYADFMQTLHVPEDFWSTVGKRPDTVEIAKPTQEFLSRVEKNYIKMRRVNQKAMLDFIIHGTCVYKDHILHDRRMVRDRTGAMVPVLRHQPVVQHIPIEQFIIPARSYDIDPDAANGAAQWVAQEFYLTKEQFAERINAESPWLPAYDKDDAAKVMEWAEDNMGENRVRETIQSEDQYKPWRNRVITLHEIHVRYAPDATGLQQDLVIVWHQPSRTVLRAIANPLLHGKRPFSGQPFLPGLGFYGLGIADLDEWAQLASTRVLNNVIDNTLLSNTIMIGAPQGMNIQPDEPIYPYKIWSLGPGEDLKAVQMGRSNPQALSLLQVFGQWSEQRTGVSELRQGDVSNVPSRTPAATTLSILAEGKKRFDMILGNLKDGSLGEMGVRILQNLVQISQTDPRWKAFAVEALGQVDGEKVVRVLEGPVHDIEAKFGMTVTATSSQVNKEAEKQSLMFLAQTMGQFYPQQMQYAQMLGDQQLMLATVTAAYNGTIELQRRLLESHDVQNPDQYLPNAQAGMQPPMQPGMPGDPAGAQGAAMGGAPAGGPQAANPMAQAPEQMAALLGLV